MDFIANQPPQIQAMLAEIGIQSIEELFQAIPAHLQRVRPEEDDGMSEYEGMRWMERLASENTYPTFDNYLGAGAYEHHIPALVGAVCSKSEFLTSYTPYQAEASQGMLQAIFEFQSSICALTGLDVSNASVYDGASACAEALLMALRVQKNRSKVLVSEALNPHYRSVVQQYLGSNSFQIDMLAITQDGSLDIEAAASQMDEQTAAILVQSPNFFGTVERMDALVARAKGKGALVILCANPVSYGLFASAAEQGADIAVGDCQPFGIPMQFGGPYAGYMACRQELVRQMPGRIVGETVDGYGKRGFVLTLQAREQHIRREKATSNICTNQALAALASLVAMLWYGKEGIPKLALTNYQRAAYLRQQLATIPGIRINEKLPIFNEFVAHFDLPIEHVQDHFRTFGIEPGVALKYYFPALDNSLLVAVTETKSKAQLERYVQAARSIGEA